MSNTNSSNTLSEQEAQLLYNYAINTLKASGELGVEGAPTEFRVIKKVVNSLDVIDAVFTVYEYQTASGEKEINAAAILAASGEVILATTGDAASVVAAAAAAGITASRATMSGIHPKIAAGAAVVVGGGTYFTLQKLVDNARDDLYRKNALKFVQNDEEGIATFERVDSSATRPEDVPTTLNGDEMFSVTRAAIDGGDVSLNNGSEVHFNMGEDGNAVLRAYRTRPEKSLDDLASNLGLSPEDLISAAPDLGFDRKVTSDGNDFWLVDRNEKIDGFSNLDPFGVMSDSLGGTPLVDENGTPIIWDLSIPRAFLSDQFKEVSGVSDANKGINLTSRVLDPNYDLYVGGQLQGMVTQTEADDIWFPLKAAFDDAGSANTPDPLVIDLDGDGVELVNVAASSVFFDVFNTGTFAMRTGWVASDDGMLVMDLDGDGLITSAAEMFHTASGTPLNNLLTYDTNTNGILDAGDDLFGDFRVWRDLNQNGVSEAGELFTLLELNIQSISLAGSGGGTELEGNTITQNVTVTFGDSTTTTASEVIFAAEASNSIYIGDYDLKLESIFLPYMRGGGYMPNLHIAVSMDNELMDMLRDIDSFDIANMASFQSDVRDMLFRWADVEAVATDAHGDHVDGRIVAFLNSYFGIPHALLTGVQYDTSRAEGILNVWRDVVDNITMNLAVQGPLSDMFPEAAYSFYSDSVDLGRDNWQNLLADAEAAAPTDAIAAAHYWVLISKLGTLYADQLGIDAATAQADAIARLGELDVPAATTYEAPADTGLGGIHVGTAGADTIDVSRGENVIFAGDGDDTINVSGGRNIIFGGAGYNTVQGGDNGSIYFVGGDNGNNVQTATGNDDVLIGGAGNDYLNGGSGNDLIYGGGGNDTLVGADGNDVIHTGTGSDIVMAGAGDDTVYAEGPYNEIYAGPGNDTVYGGDGVDIIYGDSLDSSNPNPANGGDDVLDGGAGDDIIYAQAGNDTIIGGTGNDILYGGSGDDTYIFNAGDGDDTIFEESGEDRILFGPGILTADLGFSRSGNDMVVTVGDQGDRITIKDWQLGSTIESFQFDDGSSMTAAQADELASTIVGTEGNDVIHGSSVADIIYGLGGNDTIFAEGGDDEVYGGDGNDTIFGGDGNDLIYTGDGQDIVYAGAGDDVVHTEGVYNEVYAGQGNDTVYGGDGLDIIYGDSLDGSNLNPVNGGDDVLHGGAGDDVIFGQVGNDTLVGGTGNDTLYGGSGDDTYVFNLGDGQDTIIEESGGDRIVFGAGINPADVTFSLVNSDLRIAVDGSSDWITVFGWDYGTEYHVESFEFDDGTIVLSADIPAILANDGKLPPSGETITGTAGNDLLNGTAGADTIYGLGGNDTIYGGAGDDIIVGGPGNDTMYGEDGNDTFLVEGSQGDDRFIGGNGYDRILGGDGDDTIRMPSFSPDDSIELIDGGLGVNRISGTAANNLLDFSATSLVNIASIDGGGGNDTIIGSAGDDVIIGGSGNDTMYGGDGDDTFLIDGSQGDDRFIGGNGYDRILGGDGDDTIRMPTFSPDDSIELIDGGLGVNRISGTAANNLLDFSATSLVNIASIDGGGGNDTIIGSAGDDVIIGGTGNDTMYGGDGDDTFLIDGSQGDDRFIGGNGYDRILGGDGDDTIRTATFAPTDSIELIDGGFGYNKIEGTAANNALNFSATELLNIDEIRGGGGNDTITGSAANDNIFGDAGNDTLYGGAGDDYLNGGAGADYLYGGDGDDILVYDSANIRMWGEAGEDTLKLESYGTVLNMSNTAIQSIERIDAANGSGDDEITLTIADVLRVSDTGIMRITGDSGDSVLVVDEMTRGTDATLDGADFASFTASTATLYIQLGIELNGQQLQAA